MASLPTAGHTPVTVGTGYIINTGVSRFFQRPCNVNLFNLHVHAAWNHQPSVSSMSICHNFFGSHFILCCRSLRMRRTPWTSSYPLLTWMRWTCSLLKTARWQSSTFAASGSLPQSLQLSFLALQNSCRWRWRWSLHGPKRCDTHGLSFQNDSYQDFDALVCYYYISLLMSPVNMFISALRSAHTYIWYSCV